MDAAPDFDRQVQAWESALADGSFEDVFAALEQATACLEQGSLTLERSLTCYELGAKLAAACERMLAEAELRITRLDADLERIGQTAPITATSFLDDDA